MRQIQNFMIKKAQCILEFLHDLSKILNVSIVEIEKNLSYYMIAEVKSYNVVE